MFYQSGSVWRMWDIWCYHFEGVTYQYALCMEHEADDDHWDCIALATSPDGVHWADRGVIHRKRPEADRMGTGGVWRIADGRFVMGYSELYGGFQGQRFLLSHDLIHWDRAGEQYDFFPDTRWYQERNWGRISVLNRPGGGFYAYLTARTKRTPAWPGAAEYYSVGAAETDDGLRFQAVRPPKIEWEGVPECEYTEVCDIWKIGANYYMIGGASGYNGDVWGCYTFVADSPQGPFRPDAAAYRLLGASGTAQRNSYFLNGFWREGELLAAHFSLCLPDRPYPMFFHRPAYMAPLKRIALDAGGHLRLAYWQGNDACRGAERRRCPNRLDFFGARGGYAVKMLELDTWQGVVLECVADGSDDAKGFFFEASPHDGLACFLEADGCMTVGRLEHEYNFGNWQGRRLFDERDRVASFAWSARGPKRLLLMARNGLAEVYVDGWLGQCFSLPPEWTGRIGIAGFAPLLITEMKAWRMSALP